MEITEEMYECFLSRKWWEWPRLVAVEDDEEAQAACWKMVQERGQTEQFDRNHEQMHQDLNAIFGCDLRAEIAKGLAEDYAK